MPIAWSAVPAPQNAASKQQYNFTTIIKKTPDPANDSELHSSMSHHLVNHILVEHVVFTGVVLRQ